MAVSSRKQKMIPHSYPLAVVSHASEDLIAAKDVSPLERLWGRGFLPGPQLRMIPWIQVPGFRQEIIWTSGPGRGGKPRVLTEHLYHRRKEGGPAMELLALAYRRYGIFNQR
jgi:hypothetical protein